LPAPISGILRRFATHVSLRPCGRRKLDQKACKPGSVRPLRGLAAIPLGRPLLTASRDTPGARASDDPYVPPTWSCSGRGLPCQPCCQACGGLLPHPFTLTLRPKPSGGLLSVALSLGLRRAAVSRRPVFLEPGLSSSTGLPPYQRLPGLLVQRGCIGRIGEKRKGVGASIGRALPEVRGASLWQHPFEVKGGLIGVGGRGSGRVRAGEAGGEMFQHVAEAGGQARP